MEKVWRKETGCFLLKQEVRSFWCNQSRDSPFSHQVGCLRGGTSAFRLAWVLTCPGSLSVLLLHPVIGWIIPTSWIRWGVNTGCGYNGPGRRALGLHEDKQKGKQAHSIHSRAGFIITMLGLLNTYYVQVLTNALNPLKQLCNVGASIPHLKDKKSEV